jgi:hypothetical protein
MAISWRSITFGTVILAKYMKNKGVYSQVRGEKKVVLRHFLLISLSRFESACVG